MGRELLWEVAGSSLRTALSTGEALRDAVDQATRMNSRGSGKARGSDKEKDTEIVLESLANLHRLSKAFVKV